jgi:hypothetical protein
VAVEVDGMTFGILADAVLGTMQVGIHEVVLPPVTLLHDQQAAGAADKVARPMR